MHEYGILFCSDEETDDPTELIYLPISPDIEEPEDNNWAANGSALSDQVW